MLEPTDLVFKFTKNRANVSGRNTEFCRQFFRVAHCQDFYTSLVISRLETSDKERKPLKMVIWIVLMFFYCKLAIYIEPSVLAKQLYTSDQLRIGLKQYTLQTLVQLAAIETADFAGSKLKKVVDLAKQWMDEIAKVLANYQLLVVMRDNTCENKPKVMPVKTS